MEGDHEVDETSPQGAPVAVGTPDYVRRNRDAWNVYAEQYVASAERNWRGEPCWGIWGIPEAEAHVLPASLEGLEVLEDGCGTAYVSAWLARRGARPVGLDNSPAQLATARRMARMHGMAIPLVHAAAEQLPFADARFDLVISEYGAAIWSDPFRWIPEAARVLRPGGELIFLGNSTLLMLCMFDDENTPAAAALKRPSFDMHRFEWPGDPSIEFHLTHGSWIRLLRSNGFEITELLELRPSAGATTRYPFVTLEWARKWPCEEVWKARKRG
jgi:SAM-dependent methyltransferase